MKRPPLSCALFALLSSGFFAINTAHGAVGGGRRGGAPPRPEAPAGLAGAMPGSIFAPTDTINPTGNVVLSFSHDTIQTILIWLQHNTFYTFLMSKDLPVGDISFTTRADPAKPDGGMARADVVPLLEKLLAENGVTLVPTEGATILALPSNSPFAKVDIYAGRIRPTPPPPVDAAAASGIDLTQLPPPSPQAGLTFEKDIAPIFQASCVSCHGTVGANGAARQPQSGLDLGSLATALKGGATGKDVVPGHADQSLVVLYTSGAVANIIMPPRGAPLSFDQVGIIMAWINQGADNPALAAPTDAAGALANAIAAAPVPPPPPAITPPAPIELTLPGMVGRPSMFQNVQFPPDPVNLTYNHPTNVAVILKWLADNTGFTITAAPNLPPLRINFFSTDFGQANITAKLYPGLPPAEVALGLERLLYIDGVGIVPDSSRTFGLLAVPTTPPSTAAAK